jgi:hypothetical protein
VVVADVDVELYARDEERGRGVVLEVDGLRGGFSHSRPSLTERVIIEAAAHKVMRPPAKGV